MSNESHLLSVVVLHNSRKQVLYSQKCERQVDQTNGLNKWIKRHVNTEYYNYVSRKMVEDESVDNATSND